MDAASPEGRVPSMQLTDSVLPASCIEDEVIFCEGERPDKHIDLRDMDNAIRPLAVERFDSAAVKKLTAASLLTSKMFIALYLIMTFKSEPRFREVVYNMVAQPILLWSWALTVRWELVLARHTGSFFPRPNHLFDLFKPSAYSCLMWFRLSHWMMLLAQSLCAISMLYMTIHCEALGHTITQRECVATEGSGHAWNIVLFASISCSVTLSFLNVAMCRMFYSFSAQYVQARGNLRSIASSAVMLVGILVCLIAMAGNGCDFSESNSAVWYEAVHTSNGTLVGYQLVDSLGTSEQFGNACGVVTWSVSTGLQLLFQLYGWYWIVALFCCSHGSKERCCPCSGQDSGIPQWALLLSQFYFRAIFPPQACLVMLSNSFLLGFVPPGASHFCGVSLTYDADAMSARTLPWRLILDAWGFSSDAYYDDCRVEKPSASSCGPLTWRRSSVPSDQRMRFVTCDKTDTHAQLVMTNNKQLVVAFRGTGSLSNLGTDCSVARVAVTLDENGLAFEDEDSSQVSQRVLRIAERGGMWFKGVITGQSNRCLVHGGFGRAYLSVREQLLREHAAICKSERPTSILVTGHSLGGALATLFTLQILAEKLYTSSQVSMITFGQPRVGNYDFARLFGELTLHCQCLRMVYSGDIIVGVPKMICLFKHIGVEVEVNNKGRAVCEPSPLERRLIIAHHNKPTSHLLTTYEVGIQACIRKFCSDPEEIIEGNIQVELVNKEDCVTGVDSTVIEVRGAVDEANAVDECKEVEAWQSNRILLV